MALYLLMCTLLWKWLSGSKACQENVPHIITAAQTMHFSCFFCFSSYLYMIQIFFLPKSITYLPSQYALKNIFSYFFSVTSFFFSVSPNFECNCICRPVSLLQCNIFHQFVPTSMSSPLKLSWIYGRHCSDKTGLQIQMDLPKKLTLNPFCVQGYKPPDEGPSEYQTIPLNKIEDFGVHCKQWVSALPSGWALLS